MKSDYTWQRFSWRNGRFRGSDQVGQIEIHPDLWRDDSRLLHRLHTIFKSDVPILWILSAAA